MVRNKALAALSGLAFFLLTCPWASSSQPPAATPALERAFHAMYDLDFRLAEQEIAAYQSAHPSDPLAPSAEAANVLFALLEKHHVLQAEFFASDRRYLNREPISPDPQSLTRFRSALDKAEKLATAALSRRPSDVNALFALTLVYGLRADYAALLERRDLAALRESGRATDFAGKLLALDPACYDAYVATGIQKYLVGTRSFPVRWLLRLGGVKGDVNQGMRELSLAAEKGRYLAPFARILLAVAHLRIGETSAAYRLLAQLRDQYPHNPLFAEEAARLQDSK